MKLPGEHVQFESLVVVLLYIVCQHVLNRSHTCKKVQGISQVAVVYFSFCIAQVVLALTLSSSSSIFDQTC